MEECIRELTEEISEVKSKLRKIQGEKDSLAGESQTLKEQMELYKVCPSDKFSCTGRFLCMP